MTAFRAGGISLYQLMKPVLIFGFLISCLSFVWNEVVVPGANHQYEALISRVSGNSDTKTRIEEKVNFTFYEGGYLKQMVYARKLSGNLMLDVSVIEYQKGAFSQIVFAKSAEWQSGKTWLFKSGIVHIFNGSKDSAQIREFKAEQITVEAKPHDISSLHKEPGRMNIFELSAFIAQEVKGGKNIASLQFAWNERFAIPFACLIFVLLGAPMGIRPQRTSSGIGIGLTILVILAYYGLSSVSRALGNIQILSPFIAAWLPNGVIGVVGARMLASKANGFN